MRILLMGTPDFACGPFEKIIGDNRFEVVGIVCQPDKPVGRKQILQAPPTKELAQKYNIPVFQPEDINTSDSIHLFQSFDIDIAFVVAYGKILKQEFLDLFPYGCINLHASLLPLLRGASPIHQSIIQGFEITGVTFMKIERKLDSGPILRQYSLSIDDNDIFQLYDRLQKLGAEHVTEVLDSYYKGNISLEQQDHTQATFCTIISKTDGKIDPLQESAESIIRKFRAFRAWPEIYIAYQGYDIKLKEISLTNKKTTFSQQLLVENNILYLDTADYKICIHALQIPGKKALSSIDFIHGYKTLLSFI